MLAYFTQPVTDVETALTKEEPLPEKSYNPQAEKDTRLKEQNLREIMQNVAGQYGADPKKLLQIVNEVSSIPARHVEEVGWGSGLFSHVSQTIKVACK